MGKFKDAVIARNNKIKAALLDTFKIAVLEAFSRIVMKTPVYTGHARANWLPAINEHIHIELDDTDKTGEKTIAKIQEVLDGLTLETLMKDGFVSLCNSVPYIEYLEYGTIKQAPAGMVGLTLCEWDSIVKQAFQTAKRKHGLR